MCRTFLYECSYVKFELIFLRKFYMTQTLDANSLIATVLGGSGFVGRYVVRRLVKQGWRVRVAVRNPNDAIFLKTYGEVGQVEIFKCSIFDLNALSACIDGSSVVINAVAGLLNETSRKKFKKYYIQGPELIAKQCVKLNVKKLIQISSVGVDGKSSIYSSSKAEGEYRITKIFPNVSIVRPSIIFGHEDRFFNRYASLATISPIIPIFGQKTKFQPVYVDDVALAVEKISMDKRLKGIFELGGPEILTFEELIKKMLFIIRRKRLVVNIPFNLAALMAGLFEILNKISLGLVPIPFTQDNVQQLQIDNIISGDKKSFEDLGIKPQNVDTILPLYLYSYRPHGQYNEITHSGDRTK